MTPVSTSPEANYATRNNIVHPGSAAQVTAAQTAAAKDLADRAQPTLGATTASSNTTQTTITPGIRRGS